LIQDQTPKNDESCVQLCLKEEVEKKVEKKENRCSYEENSNNADNPKPIKDHISRIFGREMSGIIPVLLPQG
jgi:hypothetical protein